MKTQKLLSCSGAVLTIASLLAFATPTFAAAPSTAPGQNKLLCFDGTTDGGFGGTCTQNSNGAKGSATLDNSSTSATGDYSGVYVQNSVIYGQLLPNVT